METRRLFVLAPCLLGSQAISLFLLASCMPLPFPASETVPTKAELALTKPHFRGVTVDDVAAGFPGFTFSYSEGETVDSRLGRLQLGASSAEVRVASHAPDKVASITTVVHRPGHANGPMLDRLAAEYFPMSLGAIADANTKQECRSWLMLELMHMSAAGHTAATTIGNIDLTLNVVRNKATLRLEANANPAAPPQVAFVPEPPKKEEYAPIKPFFQPPLTPSTTPPSSPPSTASAAPVAAPTVSPQPVETPPPVEDAVAVEETPRYTPEELQQLRARLKRLLANDAPLDTLDAIAEFRRELDAVAAEYPDTKAGSQAQHESTALGVLWLAVRYRERLDIRARLDIDEKFREIVRTYPGTRAAREAAGHTTDSTGVEIAGP
jgi:hypothetical protein